VEQSPVVKTPEPVQGVRRFLLPFIVITIMVLGKLIGNNTPHEALKLFGIKVDFIIFGAALVMIALKEKHHIEPHLIAVPALGIELAHHLYMGTDLLGHMTHNGYEEPLQLSNIGGLLLGFALMAACYERSEQGDWLPAILPDDWKGPAVLLCFVTVLSVFLDNIAAAMIGGVIAKKVFHGRLTVGFLAAIVACSNAGGAPSVVGDTTTTMMWIAGASPLDVLHAGVGTLGALLVVVPFAARQQDKHQRIQKDPEGAKSFWDTKWSYLAVVVWALGGCIAANVLFDFPAIGVWVGLIIGGFHVGFANLPFKAIGREQLKGAIFILALMATASLMPVKELPAASWPVTMGHGFVSAVFDNIPLTKLCLQQDGYDWGLLAFAVGFGGSMTWFGSSAGVALCNEFEQGKNLFAWLRQGWFIPVGYVLGFLLMVGTMGWQPHNLKKPANTSATMVVAPGH